MQQRRNKPAIADIPQIDPSGFSSTLLAWYYRNARKLPWRGIRDPYRTWLSEVMLQQTRVNAAIEHYRAFLQRFPTLPALALAREDEVLAAWSGLGYYRRARMLHRAAKMVMEQNNGVLPQTSVALRKLPGIGVYTSAAIASIAFGERIAVVDGNVERVLLRIVGWPEANDAGTLKALNTLAESLVPGKDAGDHNQAMMELGATLCLPRGPRCDICPVFGYCRTRGEHVTLERPSMRSARVQYALHTRKIRNSQRIEILLQRRDRNASLMSGMLELPQLAEIPCAEDALELLPEPMLRVRHAIVGTNYYVEVQSFASKRDVERRAARKDGLEWLPTRSLHEHPLTGLARKVLQRLRLMQVNETPEQPDVPLLIGRGGRAATAEDA